MKLMKQKRWIWISFVILLMAGVAGSILVMRQNGAEQVEIVQDGKVLYSLDLGSEEDRLIEVEYEGHVNQIEIRNHRIRVLEADCPDQVCVRMGWLDSAAPIVCLPHHLVIQFAEQSEELDAVVR